MQAVRHFQQLFGCPKLEGVVTAMNKLYMTYTEQRNMVRDLAGTLGLPLDTGRAADVLCCSACRKVPLLGVNIKTLGQAR